MARLRPNRRSAKRGTKWSAQEINLLHTMAQEGTPVRLIARILERSESAVRYRAHLEQVGLPKRSTRPK